MKELIGAEFDPPYRVRIPIAYLEAINALNADPYGDPNNGCFVYPSPYSSKKTPLRVLASNGEGWDHVSVSTPERCPFWEEMEYIKRMFFLANEVAYQLHMPESKHINNHPYTLHIWRPHRGRIALPPAFMV